MVPLPSLVLNGLFVLAFCVPAMASPVTIFAASSTQTVVEQIVAACEKRIGHPCRAVYAASSTLARQIANGAPADIYISANEFWLDYLDELGAIDSASRRVFARNSLVVIAPNMWEQRVEPGAALTNILMSGRIAIGDPDHVPAGIYAKQALMKKGLWETVRTHALRMPNVRSALAVVDRGEAESGIVYETDAKIIDTVDIVYRFESTDHEAIKYGMAITKSNMRAEVQAVYGMFSAPWVMDVIRNAGFRPGDPAQ